MIPFPSDDVELLSVAPSLLFASLHLPDVTGNLKQTAAASALLHLQNPHVPGGAHLRNACDWMPGRILGDALGLPKPCSLHY